MSGSVAGTTLDGAAATRYETRTSLRGSYAKNDQPCGHRAAYMIRRFDIQLERAVESCGAAVINIAPSRAASVNRNPRETRASSSAWSRHESAGVDGPFIVSTCHGTPCTRPARTSEGWTETCPAPNR